MDDVINLEHTRVPGQLGEGALDNPLFGQHDDSLRRYGMQYRLQHPTSA
jgi:hypothetical protein